MITPGPQESSVSAHLPALMQAKLSVFNRLINEYLEEEDPETHGVLYQELMKQVHLMMEENRDLKTLVHLFHKTGIIEDYGVMMDREEFKHEGEG